MTPVEEETAWAQLNLSFAMAMLDTDLDKVLDKVLDIVRDTVLCKRSAGPINHTRPNLGINTNRITAWAQQLYTMSEIMKAKVQTASRAKKCATICGAKATAQRAQPPTTTVRPSSLPIKW